MSLIWYTSTDNSNWTLMKTPSSYKLNWEDLDNDSYRSVTNGNLIRNVIKRRWAKLSLSWNVLTAAEVSTICSAVNKDTVYFKMKSPAWGSGSSDIDNDGEVDKFISFKGYVSKIECELIGVKIGYSLSFNIIQSEGASWQ